MPGPLQKKANGKLLKGANGKLRTATRSCCDDPGGGDCRCKSGQFETYQVAVAGIANGNCLFPLLGQPDCVSLNGTYALTPPTGTGAFNINEHGFVGCGYWEYKRRRAVNCGLEYRIRVWYELAAAVWSLFVQLDVIQLIWNPFVNQFVASGNYFTSYKLTVGAIRCTDWNTTRTVPFFTTSQTNFTQFCVNMPNSVAVTGF